MAGQPLPQEQINALMRHAETFQSGQLVCVEGQASQDLMLLLRGTLEVEKAGEVVGEIKEPGSFVGVLAFFGGGGVRTATLRAAKLCHILRILPAQVESILEATPSLSMRLVRNVAAMFVERERARDSGEGDGSTAVTKVLDTYLPLLVLLAASNDQPLTSLIVERFVSALRDAEAAPDQLVIGTDFVPKWMQSDDMPDLMAEAKEKIREIRSTRQSAGSPLERLVAGVRLEY